MKQIRHHPLTTEPVQELQLHGKDPRILGLARNHRGSPVLVTVENPGQAPEPYRVRVYAKDGDRLEAADRAECIGIFQRGGAVWTVFHERAV